MAEVYMVGGIDQARRALIDLYRGALDDWYGSPSVREAAETFGLGIRDYCDRHVRQRCGGFTWTASGSSLTAASHGGALNYDQCFREALLSRILGAA